MANSENPDQQFDLGLQILSKNQMNVQIFLD